MDFKAITDSITSGDALKKVSEQAGVTQEKAGEAFTHVMEQVQAGTANFGTMAEDMATKLGLPVDQVKSMLPGITDAIGEHTANATGAAKAALDGLNATLMASPLGGMLKGLDKDGDGNVVDDLADSVKGLFGKKE